MFLLCSDLGCLCFSPSASGYVTSLTVSIQAAFCFLLFDLWLVGRMIDLGPPYCISLNAKDLAHGLSWKVVPDTMWEVKTAGGGFVFPFRLVQSCNSLWTIFCSKTSDWWTKLRLESFVSSENSNWPTKLHLEIFCHGASSPFAAVAIQIWSSLLVAAYSLFKVFLFIYEGGEHTLNDQFLLVYLCCGCGKHRSFLRFPSQVWCLLLCCNGVCREGRILYRHNRDGVRLTREFVTVLHQEIWFAMEGFTKRFLVIDLVCWAILILFDDEDCN